MVIDVGRVKAPELNRKYVEKSNLRRKAEGALERAKTDRDRAEAQLREAQKRFDELEAETEEAFQKWKQASGSTVERP